jgi:hypothetical protein
MGRKPSCRSPCPAPTATSVRESGKRGVDRRLPHPAGSSVTWKRSSNGLPPPSVRPRRAMRHSRRAARRPANGRLRRTRAASVPTPRHGTSKNTRRRSRGRSVGGPSCSDGRCTSPRMWPSARWPAGRTSTSKMSPRAAAGITRHAHRTTARTWSRARRRGAGARRGARTGSHQQREAGRQDSVRPCALLHCSSAPHGRSPGTPHDTTKRGASDAPLLP